LRGNAWATHNRALTREPTAGLPFHALVLVTALAAGAVAQGGYYLPGRVLVAVLVAAAVGTALLVRPAWPRSWPLLFACVALATWAWVRALAEGRGRAAVPTMLTVAVLAAAVFVVERTDGRLRRWYAAGAVAIGVLIAVTGWIGVAAHWHRWAVLDNAFWRAGGTITYPNALAALLVAFALLAFALLRAQPRSLALTAAAYLLLVGLGATISRAGVLAFLVGLLVLAALTGVRATLVQVAPAVLGAVVAFAALAPSLVATAPARPAVALAGMAGGMGVAFGLTRFRPRVGVAAVLATVLLVGAGLVWAVARDAGGADATLRVLVERRVTVESSGRSGALRAVGDLVSQRPIIGVGPGHVAFSWTGPDGRIMSARYAHDEYLQVLVELGAVGLALLIAVIVAAAATIRAGRRSVDPAPLWAGAVAAVTAVAVHSGFDFLWQLPVIPLTVGLLVGLAAPTSTADNTSNEPDVMEET
jgi:O-antigen ligase